MLETPTSTKLIFLCKESMKNIKKILKVVALIASGGQDR
jgi:hypothetical protein